MQKGPTNAINASATLNKVENVFSRDDINTTLTYI